MSLGLFGIRFFLQIHLLTCIILLMVIAFFMWLNWESERLYDYSTSGGVFQKVVHKGWPMEAIAEVSTGKLDGSYTKVEYRLTATVYGKSRYGPVVHNFLITLLSVVFFAITIEYILRSTSARASAKPAMGPAPRKEPDK